MSLIIDQHDTLRMSEEKIFKYCVSPAARVTIQFSLALQTLAHVLKKHMQ